MPVLATTRRIPVSSPKGHLLGIPVKKSIIKNRRLETSLLLFPLPIVPHALSFFPSPLPMTQRGLSGGERRQSIPLKGRVTLSRVSARRGVGRVQNLINFVSQKRSKITIRQLINKNTTHFLLRLSLIQGNLKSHFHLTYQIVQQS